MPHTFSTFRYVVHKPEKAVLTDNQLPHLMQFVTNVP